MYSTKLDNFVKTAVPKSLVRVPTLGVEWGDETNWWDQNFKEKLDRKGFEPLC